MAKKKKFSIKELAYNFNKKQTFNKDVVKKLSSNAELTQKVSRTLK